MVDVALKKLTKAEAAVSFPRPNIWMDRAEDLITGRVAGLALTFGGTKDEVERAMESAVVCFTRHRNKAAQEGRFKDTVYVILKRGNQLIVKNVNFEEARKEWKTFDKHMRIAPNETDTAP